LDAVRVLVVSAVSEGLLGFHAQTDFGTLGLVHPGRHNDKAVGDLQRLLLQAPREIPVLGLHFAFGLDCPIGRNLRTVPIERKPGLQGAVVQLLDSHRAHFEEIVRGEFKVARRQKIDPNRST